MTTRDQSRRSLRRREMLKRGAALAGSAALPGGLATAGVGRAERHPGDRRAGHAAEPRQQVRRQPRHVRGDRRALRLPARLREDPRRESARVPCARTSAFMPTSRAASTWSGQAGGKLGTRSRAASAPLQAAPGRQEQLGQRAHRRGREVDLGPQVRTEGARAPSRPRCWVSSSRSRSRSRANMPSPSISTIPIRCLLKHAAQPRQPDLRQRRSARPRAARRPVGAQVPREQQRRLRSLPAATSSCAASRPCSRRARTTMGGKPAIDTVIITRGADLGHARLSCCRAARSTSRSICSRWRSSACKSEPNVAVDTVTAPPS